MVFLDKHSQEIFWLQRRIRFLMELDELLKKDASPEEGILLAGQFGNVENPSDLVARLKNIYGSDLE